MNNEIQALKEMHFKNMNMYAENILKHENKYGMKPCDYLTHQRLMESFHRGAWQAIKEVEEIIKESKG